MNAGYHTQLVPLEHDVVRNVRRPLHLLWGGVLFVLLIAAVNITNLVLVRASGRTEGARDAARARRGSRPRGASARHGDDCC